MENDEFESDNIDTQYENISDIGNTDSLQDGDMGITDMAQTVAVRVLEDHVKQKMWSFEYMPPVAKLWFLVASVLLMALAVCVIILIFQ